MLKTKFKTLCLHFSKDTTLIELLWKVIEEAYLSENRYYHKLQHLEHIYIELSPLGCTPLFEFAIFYHDIIYDVTRHDNEEQSAILAKTQLTKLSIPKVLLDEVVQLIVETKTHLPSNGQNAIFLDADLAILGSTEKVYQQYLKNIRKEYAIFDNASYTKGRRAMLETFLEQKRLYHSEYFYKRYELSARRNLENELKSFKSS